MFVNLHTLPADQAMYTLTLTWDAPATPTASLCTEEIDVVASSRASLKDVLDAAAEQLKDYDSGYRVIGVADQSAGEWLAQDVYGDLQES